MHNMSIEATIPLIIIVGAISSIIASMIGLGGGITSIPFIMIIIGDHNLEAKLISYVSIAFLSIVASFKYYKQKRKPKWKEASLILMGVIPITVISGLFLGPILDSKDMKAYFHLFYAFVVILAIILVNLKEKIKLKNPIKDYLLIPIGGFIGFLSGSFGLSGGIVFIPLLALFLKMKLKDAVVISLVLKLVTSITNIIVGVASMQFFEFEADGVYWFLPIIIIIGSFFGSQIGPVWNKKLTEKQINILFNCVMSIILIYELTMAIIRIVN